MSYFVMQAVLIFAELFCLASNSPFSCLNLSRVGILHVDNNAQLARILLF